MATTTASAPPLERILPYVVSGTSAAISIATTLAGFANSLISLATRSLSFFSPLPIILYLLAPLIVFFDIIADIFIRWPHTIALYLLDAFYPIYVFCGVACIVGLLVGGTGRLVTKLLVDMVSVKEEQGLETSLQVEEEVKEGRRQRYKAEDNDD